MPGKTRTYDTGYYLAGSPASSVALLRKKLNWSQKRLAQECYVSRATVQVWERDDKGPRTTSFAHKRLKELGWEA